MKVVLLIAVSVVLDHNFTNVSARDRKIRATIPGTGWTSMEYFPPDFMDYEV